MASRPAGTCAAPATPNELRTITVHQGTLVWLMAAMARTPRRHAMHRGGQIRQEAARALERLLLGLHRVVDGACPALDLPAAQLLLAQVLADAGHDRWAGHEHGGRGLGHDRVVAGRQPR